jgi:hypothetical protein
MSTRGLLGSVLLALSASLACGGSVTSVPAEGDSGARDGGGPGSRDASGASDGKSSDVSVLLEGSTGEASSEGATTRPYDGTTGEACTTDADCLAAGGPGIARCSNSVFAPDDLYPTAVCILPTCPVVSGPTSLHYCDGPDDPSSPGICVPSGATGDSLCIPKCTYDAKGDPAKGCQGHDVCFAYSVTMESGVGYCWAGCTADEDCQDGQHCQADRGTCLEATVPPVKTVGEACTVTDQSDYACHCFYSDASEAGYCTDFCVVGGATTCPLGYTCDSIEYRSDGYSVQNTGMGGYCVATCSTADGGTTCPANSTCSNINVGGPDCTP